MRQLCMDSLNRNRKHVLVDYARSTKEKLATSGDIYLDVSNSPFKVKNVNYRICNVHLSKISVLVPILLLLPFQFKR